MRTILAVGLLILNFSLMNAQVSTLETVDKQTYDSFIAKDYKKTIAVGTQAINQGTDFYFLRYRLGIAYYESHNYELAAMHFEKAKSFEDGDPVMLEYLYYSYVLSGRNEKAGILAQAFPEDLKAKVHYRNPLLKSVAVEFGILTTDNADKFKESGLKGKFSSGSGAFYDGVTYADVTIANSFSPKFNLVNHFEYVSNMADEIIQATVPVSRNEVFSDKENYFQWNAIGSYFIKNWTVFAGFGVYNSTYNSYFSSPPPMPNQPPQATKVTETDISGTLSLSRRFRYVEPSVSLSYTNLFSENYITAEASLTYYPFGNLAFYGNSKAAVVDGANTTNTIFTQLFGVKLFPKIWLEGYGAYGDHQNYITENGLQVYNTPNKINWYAGSNLNFYFRKFDFSLGYGIQERESDYGSGANPGNASTTTNYTYNYNLFKTKITWKF